MSRFDTNNISFIRGRYGLCWRKSYPTFHDIKSMLKTAAIIAFLLSCYGLVALNDARAIAVEGEIQSSQMLVNLASGGTILAQDGSFAAKCENWVEAK